jgi:hypothetical protein
MAYVHPRETSRDVVAVLLRNGTRVVAVAAYTVAVLVAFVILAPILPTRGSDAAFEIPAGPTPVPYTLQPGDTPASVASAHGLSLAQLYSLNPDLTPFTKGGQVVVGLR